MKMKKFLGFGQIYETKHNANVPFLFTGTKHKSSNLKIVRFALDSEVNFDIFSNMFLKTNRMSSPL